ncbi:MAG: hypothetical protein ACSNEK_05015 [Parachlamydiaceae bacterium]
MSDWRSKSDDINLIHAFSESLKEFKRLKLEKWEKIEEEVQRSIKPGTPSEDWIIPPDENKVYAKLQHDPEYLRLRKNIIELLPSIKECAQFLSFQESHDYDWVKFTSPLIGNSALEDAISTNDQLLNKCLVTNYFWRNVISFFS